MKYGIFFRLNKFFKNQTICVLFTNLVYFLFCIKYFVKKLMRTKQFVALTFEQAHNIINQVYPHPVSEPVYNHQSIDESLDLSIIIPVYNYAEIIYENISSVLNQKTKYSYELIIVDDGSTDGAGEIIKQFESDPRVRLIYQNNGGIAVARNTGLNHAKGKYIMFVDCDDIVHDDIVETLMDEAYRGNYSMVMCAHNLVKERAGETLDVIPNIYPDVNLLNYRNHNEIMNLAGLPWCKVYRHELWENVRYFPGYWHEDNIIQFLIFMQQPTYKYIPKIEYEYKWYEKNFSHVQGDSANIKSIDVYWILIDILEKYKSMQLPLNNAFYTLLLTHLSLYYYSCINQLDNTVLFALFVLGKELYIEYKPSEPVKLPYMLRQVEKAFDNNDIELWKLASCYV